MLFWLIVVGVVSLSIGFVMGATFRQYRKPQVGPLNPANMASVKLPPIVYSEALDPMNWIIIDEKQWRK